MFWSYGHNTNNHIRIGVVLISDCVRVLRSKGAERFNYKQPTKLLKENHSAPYNNAQVKKSYPSVFFAHGQTDKNIYDEPIGYRIIGVELGSSHEVSRIHVRDIKMKPKVSKDFCDEIFSPPWSSVNNCIKP